MERSTRHPHPLGDGRAEFGLRSFDQPRRVTQLKFKRPIYPGDELQLELERNTFEVRFTLFRISLAGPELCTRGTLIFTDATR